MTFCDLITLEFNWYDFNVNKIEHNPSRILVLRPHPDDIPDNFNEKVITLCRVTKYIKGEYQQDLAPELTDCATAAAYVLQNCKKWNLEWIANMPRKLLSDYRFTVAKGLAPGDLLFLANRKGETKHVAVAVSDSQVFHCSKQVGGACIETINDIFSRCYPKSGLPIYYEIDNPLHLLTQIDKRTNYNPVSIAAFRKNKKDAKKSLADHQMCQQPNHSVFFINYSFVSPRNETMLYGNPPYFMPSVELQSGLASIRRDEQNIASMLSPSNGSPMDCSVTPPSSPNLMPTGYDSANAVPPMGIEQVVY